MNDRSVESYFISKCCVIRMRVMLKLKSVVVLFVGSCLLFFRALESCMLVMHPQCPPAVHPAMKVFTSGLQDPDWMVSGCCQRALTVLRSVTQPRIPPLEFWSSGMLQDQLLTLQMAARTCSAGLFLFLSRVSVFFDY